jgi:adenylate cyclase class 2
MEGLNNSAEDTAAAGCSYTRMMKILNYEFKARLRNVRYVRSTLRSLHARFVGTDRQVDTYFRCPHGRLKLREGNIENALIYYERPDAAEARASRVQMANVQAKSDIKAVLSSTLGVLTVVEKRREIYFVDNVKIHLDRIRDLGDFIEVEAIRELKGRVSGSAITNRMIRQQARKFQKLFRIADSDIIAASYSDMLLQEMPKVRAGMASE